jgi:hypothetical protein
LPRVPQGRMMWHASRKEGGVPKHWWRPVAPGNPSDGYPELEKELGGRGKIVRRWKSRDGKRKYAIVIADKKPGNEAILLVDDDLLDD